MEKLLDNFSLDFSLTGFLFHATMMTSFLALMSIYQKLTLQSLIINMNWSEYYFSNHSLIQIKFLISITWKLNFGISFLIFFSLCTISVIKVIYRSIFSNQLLCINTDRTVTICSAESVAWQKLGLAYGPPWYATYWWCIKVKIASVPWRW